MQVRDDDVLVISPIRVQPKRNLGGAHHHFTSGVEGNMDSVD